MEVAMISPKKYQPNLEPLRFARNGMIPSSAFVGGSSGFSGRQNHSLSYRRKCFLATGDFDNAPTGVVGDTVLYRAYCHTGHATTHIGFRIGMGLDSHASATDPRIEVKITISGGASTTATVRHGINSDGTSDAPYQMSVRRLTIAANADTRYEIEIKAINYARPVFVVAYEIAPAIIDEATDYFHESQVSVGHPVFDNLRSRALIGMSQMWRHNGSHLLTWPGAVDGTSPTYSTATWTNVLDATTAVAASSAGYYLGGDADTYLTRHCRQSDGTTLNVVLAVHGSCSILNTGEVRLEDSTGTRCSITGITTTPQWHVATTTIANVDTMGKVDLQARTGSVINTFTLNAACLFSYLA
jgi:hypothetical protein